MVRGLDKFREQFRVHAGQYVLIGGAAAKHKNDVFRLYRLIDPAFKTNIPKDIRDAWELFWMRWYLNKWI